MKPVPIHRTVPALFMSAILFALGAAVLGPLTARAATYTWTGAGSDGNWSTAANWSGNLGPSSDQNATLIFGGTAQLNSIEDRFGGFVLNNLTFGSTAGAFVLSGKTGTESLVFQRSSSSVLPVLTQSSSATETIRLNLQLSDALTIGGTGTGALLLNGTVSGSGALTVAGAGTVSLTGTNTYTGGTNLNSGTLSLGSAQALGTSGTISFGGGTLQYTAAGTTDYSSRFSTADNQAFVIDTNGQNVAFATGLTSNGGSLTKLGLGTLTLNGTGAYTGATTVNAGTLILNDGANASVAVNNANLQVQGGTIVTGLPPLHNTTGDPGVVLSGSGTLTNGGSIIGGRDNAGVVLDGSGMLTNNSAITGGPGGTGAVVSGGTLLNTATISGGIASSSPRGGTGVAVSGGASTNDGTITGGNGGNAGVGLSVSGGAFTNDGTITGGSGGSFNGVGGAGAALSGGTLFNDGTITGGVGSDGSSAASVVSGGAAGALFNRRGGSITNGVALGNFANSVTLQIGSTIAGGLNLGTSTAATLTLTDDGTGGSQVYSAAVAGGTTFSGTLIKANRGTWIIDQALGTPGGVTVAGGTLQVGATGNVFGSNPAVTLANAAGATLDLHDFNLQIGSLAGGGTSSGNVTLGSGNLTLGGDNTNTTFAGIISGSGGLIKNGTGTFTLAGTNTFTGGVIINAGILSVASESNLGGGGAITVNGSSQLLFTGGATLTRTYNLTASTTLAVSSGNTLILAGATINGGFLAGPGTETLANGTTLNNTRAGSGTVLTQSGGTVAFNNVTLSGNSTFTQAAGATLNTAGDFITTPQTTLTVKGTVNAAGGDISGALTINNGGVVNTSGGAAAPLYLDGSRGTTVNAGGTLNAASGSTIELGGLLVNNGTQTGVLDVNLGGVVRGTGTYGTVNVGNSGYSGVNTLATGGSANSLTPIYLTGSHGLASTAFVGPQLMTTPGKAYVTSLTLGSGSIFAFSVQDAANTNGNGYDTVSASGVLTLVAGTTMGSQITVTVTSLGTNGTAGQAGNFDPSKNYAFVLVSAGGGITGFNPAEFTLDTSGFQNATNGGSFSLVQAGNNLDLVFTSAVPEPGTWVLLLTGVGGLLLAVWRRSRQVAA